MEMFLEESEVQKDLKKLMVPGISNFNDTWEITILKEKDEISEQLEGMNINFVGSELVFATESSPLIQEEYLEHQHKKGRVLWVNSLLYSYKAQLSAGHTDDIAVAGDPDYGWGWLIDKGFDVIQTDWVLQLRGYMSNKK